MGSLEQAPSSHWRGWWLACPVGREGLRRAFELSLGPTALAARQVKVGVSAMAAKGVAYPGLKALERRRKLGGLGS